MQILIQALLSGVSEHETYPEAEKALTTLFESHPSSIEAGLKAYDTTVEVYPILQPLEPYLFDLWILKNIEEMGTEEEEFIESPEWEQLELLTVDRGSELLNLLIYLRDCAENDVEPSLSDFLNEFLLVEENDYQDEFFIYEPFIKQEGLLEADTGQIIATGNKIEADEVADLFSPTFLFFQSKGKFAAENHQKLLSKAKSPGVQAGIYALLTTFQRALL